MIRFKTSLKPKKVVRNKIFLSVCHECYHFCRFCLLYSRSKTSSNDHKTSILGQQIYARIILDFSKLNPCFDGKS